ncbi:MAG: DUF1295 domain-containing protein [Firmicutes bacterium]|nr:DUF1295 domain-containing protein [Bacillota bacterium]
MEKVCKSEKEKSLLIVAAIYVVAAFIVVLGAPVLYTYVFDSQILGLYLSLLIADIVATLFVWGMGLVFKNSSMYDPYWSVIPPFVVLTAIIMSLSFGAVEIILFALVLAFGIRLTYNWASGWKGLSHEDWRYADLRKSQKTWFVSNLLGVHLMPTLLVFLGLLPAITLAAKGADFSWFIMFGAVVCAGAIVLEGWADWQLRKFNSANKGDPSICNKGLWKMCRHPNYLGQILFWWGIYFMQLAIYPTAWWTFVGALAITLLFVFISIPLVERKICARKGFNEYYKTVPMLFPFVKFGAHELNPANFETKPKQDDSPKVKQQVMSGAKVIELKGFEPSKKNLYKEEPAATKPAAAKTTAPAAAKKPAAKTTAKKAPAKPAAKKAPAKPAAKTTKK